MNNKNTSKNTKKNTKKNTIENQLRLYPVWSNFIYFIAGIYSLSVGLNAYNKILNKFIIFTIFGLILIITGSVSINYHVNTPSWTGNPNTIETKEYKTSLEVDKIFAILTVVWALSIFFYLLGIIWYKNNIIFVLNHLVDYNFFLSILFIILSGIFFIIAKDHNHSAVNCNENNSCFSENIDAYDIFHSNWHIFTSIAAIFWISFLKDSYSWKKF